MTHITRTRSSLALSVDHVKSRIREIAGLKFEIRLEPRKQSILRAIIQQSRGFETLRHLTVGIRMGYCDSALV